MAQTKRFDPEAHLHKQGWQGKGTAFKQGHATRPLPVVRKKNLGGIGKDRDEAVPFWDNIFAATAASILSSTTPSANPSPAGTPKNGSPAPVAAPPEPPKTSMSIAARVSRESARRGLYSRFFRGTPMAATEEDESSPDTPTPTEASPSSEHKDTVAGPSGSSGSSRGSATSTDATARGKSEKGKARDTETKEEKAARRAERAAKKAQKEQKRAMKEQKKASKEEKRALKEAKRNPGEMMADSKEEDEKSKKKRKRKDDGAVPGTEVGADAELDTVSKRSKSEKRKKEKEARE